MPLQATYPGVYIEEVPSGVRTITGVATSITAFVGRASRGPTDDPTVINSFADFQRLFGGLAVDSTMSYAVRDFYQNGGSQGLIVRVVNGALNAWVDLPTGSGTLRLEAASPGEWGNNLYVTVDYATRDLTRTDLFNITLQEIIVISPTDQRIAATETFLNVSSDENDPRFLTRVLANGSNLASVNNWTPSPDRPLETFGSIPSVPSVPPNGPPHAARQFHDGSNGADLNPVNFVDGTNEADKTGLYALLKADLFNLLCIPPPVRGGDTPAQIYSASSVFCRAHRAMLIVDSPVLWSENDTQAVSRAIAGRDGLGVTGLNMQNAALYFPLIVESDPLRDNQLDNFVPCGAIAGIMATTDATRGVWKAPAGTAAALNGVTKLSIKLTDAENGQLNPLGVNCLRQFADSGRVVWGARTMRGADVLADEYKYVPVRRLALFIEESLYRGTQWVVFEPNDEPLWSQIRLNVGSFMHQLFRQGAFQGTTPKEAYLVKCDKETTTQADINAGVVNIVVGFAPLKPAEFVIISIQQLAGQIAT